jgi:2-methylcitrate dehydratase PrpD
MMQAARALRYEQLPAEVVQKVKTALFDMLSCAYEAQDLPWSQQAIEIASRSRGDAHVIGTALQVPVSEAAFVNAILGHGLVREDMHTGSVSHLGVVVLPTLLALAESKKVSGRDFILAAVCGYEAGCSVGRAVMDQENVRQYRPTGITGPIGAAVAGSRLLGLSEDAAVSALGFAANTTVGLNEWPYSGGDEMFFHVGFAARNAVTSVELAELGARASETSLDGPAGLFAALRRTDHIADVTLFSRPRLEILEVYHKPAPACNYAQTATQIAQRLACEDGVRGADVTAIHIKATAAAVGYPGCNYAGPFTKTLQAKMSIHFCAAAALSRGVIEEANYRNLADPEINRLAGITTIEIDPALTAAYPAKQGAEMIVTLRNGETRTRSLSDVVPATPEQIRARFRSAAEKVLGAEATRAAESFIDSLDQQEDAGALARLLGAPARPLTHHSHAEA